MNFLDARKKVIELVNDRKNAPGGPLQLISHDKILLLVHKPPPDWNGNFIANITDYERREGLTAAKWDYILKKIFVLCDGGLL